MTRPDTKDHEKNASFMAKALALAGRSFDSQEVPVGAIVVVDGKIVGKGFNQTVGKTDPTAHAEILALRQAARRVGNYRLTSATVYCTLEPCVMCAGALIWARISCLVYGARDPKAGAIDSHLGLAQSQFANHGFQVISGVFGSRLHGIATKVFPGETPQGLKLLKSSHLS